MTPHAYAHLENATLRIDVEHEKKLQVPLHHLGGVVCFGNVMVSPALMHRLADEGKSLVLLDDSGRSRRGSKARCPATFCCVRRITAWPRSRFSPWSLRAP